MLEILSKQNWDTEGKEKGEEREGEKKGRKEDKCGLWKQAALHSNWDFPVRSPSHLQHRRPGFNPWVGKIPWRREWLPTPVFLPGEFHGQTSLAGYSPWGCKEWDTTEWLTLLLCDRQSGLVRRTWTAGSGRLNSSFFQFGQVNYSRALFTHL